MGYKGYFIDEEVRTRKEPVFEALRNAVVYDMNYSRILDMVATGEYIWLDTDEIVLFALREMNAG